MTDAGYLWCDDQLRQPCDGVLALRAERDRLREALERIAANNHQFYVNDDGTEGEHLDWCPGCFAREALGGG